MSQLIRYMPIIPLVLVNGSEGIGTGWSSYIPNYNPRDVVANVRRLLNDEMMEPMDPWYRGFKVTYFLTNKNYTIHYEGHVQMFSLVVITTHISPFLLQDFDICAVHITLGCL